MIVFIFFAVGLCLNKSTSQTTDCTYLRELCLSDADGCKHAWRIMEDACSVSGNTCQMKNSSSCDLSIQSLVESNLQFKDCLCSDDLYCTFNKLLGKKCINESEESALSSNLASHSNVTEWLHEKETSLTMEKKSDCAMAARMCQESEHCALLYESFKKTCRRESEQCKTLDGSYVCSVLRESLQETVLWNCQCSDPLKAECTEIWKSLSEDICIKDAQINPGPSFIEDNENELNLGIVSDNIKEDNKYKWNLTTLSYHGGRGVQSCLEVAEVCVGDALCNAQLALYLKACSADGKLCDVKHCQAAIRFFYQNMPFNIAQMLAFCDCAPADEPCQQSREALHSRPCAVNRVPTPTCLDVIHSCQDDELCRRRYRTFQAKCWQHVMRKCHEDETCIGTLSKQDLTCSGSDDCKAAYIGTLGTVLQVQCTCRTITQNEESLCKIFQHMLHRKSCFSVLRNTSQNSMPPTYKPSSCKLSKMGTCAPKSNQCQIVFNQLLEFFPARKPFTALQTSVNILPVSKLQEHLSITLVSDYLTLSKVKGVALQKGNNAKEITLSGFHPPFNGEVVYVFMCLTATCGILLLVMVKLRTFRILNQNKRSFTNPNTWQTHDSLRVTDH